MTTNLWANIWRLVFSSEGDSLYAGGRGVINFWKENGEGGVHKIIDDQNVGTHKMTADSVFILFKQTDFDTISACLGG